MCPMIVAVFTGLYPPAARGGGPTRSTEALTQTAPSGIEPKVITSDADLGERAKMPVPRNVWSIREGVPVRYTSDRSPFQLLRGFSDLKRSRPSLLYFNSFFSPSFTILPLLLWRFGYWGKPVLLLAPRGQFGKEARSRKSRKKRLYIRMFRILGIQRFVIWHSTAEHETDDIQHEWGSDARIVLRENQTLLPDEPTPPDYAPQELPRFAFVGRLVEHKGLAVALGALRRSSRPLALDIYGPEEDPAYVRKCKELLSELPQNVDVRFMGPLSPWEVRPALISYDALLMPTAGENFGHVIAEALSVSCPVIATSKTPWTETLRAGGGEVVDGRDLQTWTEAIGHFAGLTADARMKARQSAGDAYRRWRARPEKPHVWILALDAAQTWFGPGLDRS